ncbi:hypothetical protein ACFRAQ_36105 [Nocardia sp. NPDC056611]|uniref:hypothetical protein n=1 Tax=Nocardia sp. NPDC056611 TaxID=3345877 RepID=UPI00366AE14D
MNVDTVRDLLGLPDDPARIAIETSPDANEFATSECWVGEPHPACVHVDWYAITYDRDTDAPKWGGLEQEAFCLRHAREILADILEEAAPFVWSPDEPYCKPYGVDPDDPMMSVVVHSADVLRHVEAAA